MVYPFKPRYTMDDTLGLFEPAAALETMPMIDADVKFMRDFYRPPLCGHYMNILLREIAWRQETIRMWDKQYLQPRLSAWYGDAGMCYTYSSMTLEPNAWTPTLLQIKEDIERASGACFNSVLLNLYRNEHDSVGWHSDNEAEFGDKPMIASLSLGQTRIFKLRHKRRKEQKRIALELTDGSLLLMAGTTQKYWQHAIEKERHPCGPRINLTFRDIVLPCD